MENVKLGVLGFNSMRLSTDFATRGEQYAVLVWYLQTNCEQLKAILEYKAYKKAVRVYSYLRI